MKVFVATYEHRHGTDVSVYAARELAEAARQDVARESWWELFCEGTDEPFDDETPASSASLYFSRISALADEWFKIEECDVVGSSSPIRMFDALEVFANRATAPFAEMVPDDGTVTLFMKDCRAAQAARQAEEDRHDAIDVAIAEQRLEEMKQEGI